ncbi:hypothetical protein [Frankia sp. AgW1.1]|uniref:hypothetical protein n=1 Tax=Frankia sp. AgW1.1 TaxID=1836971 RepID=UPI0019319BB3|nr:hypothetical protein [Frankia sp. AgW1.1]MBL7487140.1 hypothetical protein [Frankia sp. AgW1.1]
MTVRLCCCGHDRQSHKHYTPYSDCARCDCDHWAWRWVHLSEWSVARTNRRLIDSAFTDLVAMSDELGLYDLDQAALDDALRDARRKLADD